MTKTLTDVLSTIDMEKVGKAIATPEEDERPLADFDFEDAKSLVWTAAEKWLLRDLDEFSVEEVEQEKVFLFDNSNITYVTDVSGVVKGLKAPFTNFSGKRYVIDWKTSKNTLGTEWKDRLLHSWQWRLYCCAQNASLFLYRGLSRNGDTKEVIIEAPTTNNDEVLFFLRGTQDQLVHLQNSTLPCWPRNMPFACRAYGRDCAWVEDCQNYTMPKGIVEPKRLSYSYINTFMLCNERARRTALDGNRENSEESLFGSAVHRGLAELWRQAFNL